MSLTSTSTKIYCDQNNWFCIMLFSSGHSEMKSEWFRRMAHHIKNSLQIENPNEPLPKAINEIISIIEDPNRIRDIIINTSLSSSSSSSSSSSQYSQSDFVAEMKTFCERYERINLAFPDSGEILRQKRHHDEERRRKEEDDIESNNSRDNEYVINQKAVGIIVSSDMKLRISTYYKRIILLFQLNHWLRFHFLASRDKGCHFNISNYINEMRVYLIFMIPYAWPEIQEAMNNDRLQYPMPNDMFRMFIMSTYRTKIRKIIDLQFDSKINYEQILETWPTIIDSIIEENLQDLSKILYLVYSALNT